MAKITSWTLFSLLLFMFHLIVLFKWNDNEKKNCRYIDINKERKGEKLARAPKDWISGFRKDNFQEFFPFSLLFVVIILSSVDVCIYCLFTIFCVHDKGKRNSSCRDCNALQFFNFKLMSKEKVSWEKKRRKYSNEMNQKVKDEDGDEEEDEWTKREQKSQKKKRKE